MAFQSKKETEYEELKREIENLKKTIIPIVESSTKNNLGSQYKTLGQRFKSLIEYKKISD
jgi:hypothetical protein